MSEFVECDGRDLRVGDIIAPWGGPDWGRTSIVRDLYPYEGNLAHLWAAQGGARIARLQPHAVDGRDAFKASAMTIDPIGTYWRKPYAARRTD